MLATCIHTKKMQFIVKNNSLVIWLEQLARLPPDAATDRRMSKIKAPQPILEHLWLM
jgi:hypothetical protein